jgi:hypothetical protein
MAAQAFLILEEEDRGESRARRKELQEAHTTGLEVDSNLGTSG